MMKKFSALFLAVTMVFCFASTTFATEIDSFGDLTTAQEDQLNELGSPTAISSERHTKLGTILKSPAIVVATQYVVLPYFSKLTRPASGAPVGSTISMKSTGVLDCGAVNTASNTTFVVCVSDGTNWKSIP